MTETAKGRMFVKNGGCNEDCLNCPYPDCYKPALQNCRYCCNAYIQGDDVFYCDKKNKLYSGSTGKTANNCKYFEFNPMQSSQVSDDFYCGFGELKEREKV